MASGGIQEEGAQPEEQEGYYNIMLIGTTGQGKSTTADKLLIANPSQHHYEGGIPQREPVLNKQHCQLKMDDITMWLLHASSEIPEAKTRVKCLIYFRKRDDPHKKVNDARDSKMKIFTTTKECEVLSNETSKVRVMDVPGFRRVRSALASGANAVFKPITECEVLSNETTKVRIMDVPGFFDGASVLAAKNQLEVPEGANPMSPLDMNNLDIMRKIIRIQTALSMKFNRILYFLPERGPLETSHEILQMELEQMVHFFGKSIFDCMVLIATVNPDAYQYLQPDVVPFSSDTEMKIRRKFQEALNNISLNRVPLGEQLPDQKPPIVFISMNDTCEDIYANIKSAPVIYNGMRLVYKHGICDYCGHEIKFLGDPSCCIPYKQSLCHPLMIQKNLGITKLLNFGGIYRTLTGKSYQPDENCIHCRKIPGESGCMKVRTYYIVKNETLLVDHKFRIMIDDEDSTFSFLQKEIFKCDHSGFQYSMKSYGITLIVPKGSVAIGKEIHMEIGVTLCGPFSFPRGTRFISPIVSLRLLGENALTEPFQLHVTLRHILGELTELKARHHRVQFCCNDYDSSDPGTYKFHLNDDGFISQSFTGNYGRVITKKFCLLCVTAADTPEVQSEIGYRLTRIVCTSELKNEAYLCLSYDAYLQVYYSSNPSYVSIIDDMVNTIQAMKRQFPEDSYALNTSNCVTFAKFSARLQFIPENNDNCTLTMDQAGVSA